MTGKIQSHETSVSLVKTPPAELDAGSDMILNVRVKCASASDLRGKMVEITSKDGVGMKSMELGEFDGAGNETGEFVVQAPARPGEYTWTLVFRAQEKEGVSYSESSYQFSFTVKPHATSMAVWDVPSPVFSDTKFEVKVGVMCSSGCNLAGRKIEIYDNKGIKVASGRLGSAIWPATNLYWAAVEIEGPGTLDYYQWTAKFPGDDLELSHKTASYPFGFITAKPPEHMVTVQAVDQDTKAPLHNVRVDLHPYRKDTDEAGVAKVGVAGGKYELYVMKGDYQVFQTNVEVAGDIAITAELKYDPVKDDGR